MVASANTTFVAYNETSGFRVPSTGNYQVVRTTGDNLGDNTDYTQSRIIRPAANIANYIATRNTAGGPINGEFFQDGWAPFIRGALQSSAAVGGAAYGTGFSNSDTALTVTNDQDNDEVTLLTFATPASVGAGFNVVGRWMKIVVTSAANASFQGTFHAKIVGIDGGSYYCISDFPKTASAVALTAYSVPAATVQYNQTTTRYLDLIRGYGTGASDEIVKYASAYPTGMQINWPEADIVTASAEFGSDQSVEGTYSDETYVPALTTAPSSAGLDVYGAWFGRITMSNTTINQAQNASLNKGSCLVSAGLSVNNNLSPRYGLGRLDGIKDPRLGTCDASWNYRAYYQSGSGGDKAIASAAKTQLNTYGAIAFRSGTVTVVAEIPQCKVTSHTRNPTGVNEDVYMDATFSGFEYTNVASETGTVWIYRL